MIGFLHIVMLYNVNNLCVKEWDLNKLLSISLSADMLLICNQIYITVTSAWYVIDL